MKIRTDFVTNSSSSSFVVEVEVELNDKSRYVFETKPTEEGANSNLKCSGADITNVTNVDELCDLLQKSMAGTGKAKMKAFTGEIKENVEHFEDIESVTLRRIWITMGESSGLTIVNDMQLQKLAQTVTKAKGTEKEAACDELLAYLNTAEVYTEGGWSDTWPSAFGKNTAIPRYKWDHLGLSVEALAKKIVAGKIDNNDMAVETIAVNMKDKTVTESADFIIDSKESGIGKKPACRSNKFFTNVITTAWPDYDIRQSVEITDFIPDCNIECDPLDYVLYKDGIAKAAASIKTAANGKSKTFKALATLCPSIPLEYVVLDEKKDSTELKIISKINETIFAPAFAKYVVNQESEPITEVEAATSGEGYSVKVKFADNRSYEYNCFSEIQVGDIVLVGCKQSSKMHTFSPQNTQFL